MLFLSRGSAKKTVAGLIRLGSVSFVMGVCCFLQCDDELVLLFNNSNNSNPELVIFKVFQPVPV